MDRPGTWQGASSLLGLLTLPDPCGPALVTDHTCLGYSLLLWIESPPTPKKDLLES